MTAPPAGALEACLALLEKATPGEWMFRDYAPDGPVSDGLHTNAACKGGGDVVCVNPMRDGYENSASYWEANAEAIATAVNFLRDHGPALLAALRLREWLPIESAPRDGTEILAWRTDCGILLVRWTAPVDFLTQTELEAAATGDDDWMEEPDWFYADFVSGGRLDGTEAPTHWMPRPAPPTADDLARVLEEGE